MNLMGKIFTFLIFVMSTVFLVVSIMVGASDRNWKEKATEMKTRASSASSSIDSLKDTTVLLEKTLEFEKSSRALQLKNLQTLNVQTQSQLEDKSQQFNEVQKTSQALGRELQEANRRLADQDKELADIKLNNKELVDKIAAEFDQNRNFEKVIFKQTSELEQLTQKEADLAAQLALANKVLTANGLTLTDLTASIAPKIEAVVTAVGERGDKFAIMAGMDDGLRKGHEMDIYRSNRHVGVGVVIASENNRSVLSIVKGMMNDIVQEGDNVTTKL